MLPGPSCCSARPRAMEQRSPKHHHRRARPGACKPHGHHPLGNCGRASTASSRCRHVRPVGPINRWATDRTGGERLPRQAPRRLRHIAYPGNLYLRATREQTQRDEPSAGGEGLPQTTPLLSVRGCKWGPTPLSSMNKLSSVRLSCLAPKLPETHPKVEVEREIICASVFCLFLSAVI